MELNNKTLNAVISTTNIDMQVTSTCVLMSMSNSTHIFFDNSQSLLVRAFNNRTRERNYFKLYCEMLDGDITEAEFDEAIDKNPDDYVVPTGDDDSIANIQAAISLSQQLKSIDTIDDFTSIFQFSENKINKCLEVK